MKVKHIFLPVLLVGALTSCQKTAPNPTDDTIVILLEDASIGVDVDTKTTPVTSIPSTLYWGATTGGNAAGSTSETVKWATASKSVTNGAISTGKYLPATPSAINYYVANQTFTAGGSMTVANNSVDIICGRTFGTTLQMPVVALNHIFARTGNLTLNVPDGQTSSSVSWQIRGVSSISGTAGTYNMSTGWSSASTRLSDWTTITSGSDMYLIPGTYEVKVSFTLTNSGNSQTYTEVGEILLLDGKINHITATTTSEAPAPSVSIAFTVSVTPWTSVSQSLEAHELYGKHNGYDFVDLGCRKGMYKILFADRNVGASSITDYGDYFAWGETSKRYTSISGTTINGADFVWANAPYHVSSTPGPYYDWKKYVLLSESTYGTPDNILILTPTDDAATTICGGQWSIPTDDELQWLIDNCSWTWQSDFYGVAGYLIQGNGSFSSGHIFLPASGFCDNTTLQGAGTIGDYWSSSRTNIGHTQAYGLGFSSSGRGLQNNNRYLGQSIRPVCRIKDEKATAALPGEFSVSSTKKVCFSRGNLQAVIGHEHYNSPDALADGHAYTAKRWQIADNQWDYIGENYVVGSSYNELTENEVIDLFGIVTDGTINCYGILTSEEIDDYCYDSPDLWTEWGDIPAVRKEIGYGWRLLTCDEANYLFSTRSGAASKYGFGRIGDGTNYVNGLIILPDSWSKPSTCTFTSGAVAYSTNTYRYDYDSGSSNAWCDMENAGAVFLPAAGYNYTSGASHDGYDEGNHVGRYWTSDLEGGIIGGGTPCFSTIVFVENDASLVDFSEVWSGSSVRLVKEI